MRIATRHNYALDLAKREAQQRADRDPRQAEDLYLPGLAQQMRTAHQLLASAPTPEAAQTILQPIANRLDDARRWATLRGDHGRAAAAERRLAAVHRLFQRSLTT